MSPVEAAIAPRNDNAPAPMSGRPELAAAGKVPLWARLYDAYNRNMPPHRGRRRVLKLIHGLSRDDSRPFVWRMRNGAWLALSTIEAGNPHTVSVTCLEQGVWDPQVENALRRLLQPGSTALDVGANLGYVSAVMAQCVGAAGRVYAFEPVPATLDQLRLCKELNGFDSMTVLPLALGSEAKTLEIGYDPNVVGQASLYTRNMPGQRQTSAIQIRPLDALITEGLVAAPDVMKIDVEGHELDVIRGAVKTLRAHRPHIIFEYNTETAQLAGWNLRDMALLLRECGDYHLYQLTDTGAQALDVERVTNAAQYQLMDVLATTQPKLF